MDAGKVEISLFAAKQPGFHRDKSLERAAKGLAVQGAISLESRVDETACLYRVFQAFYQDLIVVRRPVIDERIVPDDPLFVLFAPAFYDVLMADETVEQFQADLICAERPVADAICDVLLGERHGSLQYAKVWLDLAFGRAGCVPGRKLERVIGMLGDV